jgi:thiol-disulfide isomerase/thioredoxin
MSASAEDFQLIATLPTARPCYALAVFCLVLFAGCDRSTTPSHSAATERVARDTTDSSLGDRPVPQGEASVEPSADIQSEANSGPVAAEVAASADQYESLESIFPMEEAVSTDDLKHAAIAQQAGDDESAARLASQAVSASPDRPDVALKAAEILVRAGHLEDGIGLLERTYAKHGADTKTALMLVSALRLQARTSDSKETQLLSLRSAGDLMRQLAERGALRDYGAQGYDLFKTVALQEAKGCAASGLKDEALVALRGLLNLGYTEIAALADDSMWDPIRDAPEFQSLIAEHRSFIRDRLQVGVRRLLAENRPFEFEFRLRDYQGKAVSSLRFAGKIMVVDFWGTWCGPCRMMTPNLIRLHQEYGDQLSVVGIAYEKTIRSQWGANIESYVKEHEIPYPCLLGDAATQELARIDAFPTLLFVDKSGIVRFSLRGYHNYERLDAIADLLINGASR